MKFAIVAALAVATVDAKHHWFKHLAQKIEDFHHKHPHPIREMVEHHKQHMENHLESEAGPSKKELMKELLAVKKQIVEHEAKLKAEEYFVAREDKLIAATEAELKKLIEAKASKEKIASVTAALAVEKKTEAAAVKDEAVEKNLITTETAEAKKLWEEIKKLPGSEESGDTPTKKELMKKLWAVKKQMWHNETRLQSEQAMVKLDDKAIAKTEAVIKKLIENKASKEEIEAVTATLALEKAKEVEIEKNEVAVKDAITQEKAEAAELWAEIKKLPSKKEEQYKMDVIKLEQIVDGILRGALDAEDLTDISTCITDMETIFGETEQAVKDFEAGGATNILAGLKEIGNVLQHVDVDMKDCSAAKEDWPRLEALAKVFQSPKSFAYHVGKDILVNGKDIFHEIEASVSDYKAENWEQFGLDVGEAAAKTILGDEEEGDDDVVVEEEDLFLY